jgi:hypothetical protein
MTSWLRAYRRAGYDDRRRSLLIAKERARRPQLSPPGRVWNALEDGLVAYGYRTWQALIPLAVLIVAGTIVFANAHANGQITVRNRSQQTPDFRPLLYTLDTLVPVVNLGQRDSWVPDDWAQIVAMVFVVAGWILTTAVVAALSGLVRRSN